MHLFQTRLVEVSRELQDSEGVRYRLRDPVDVLRSDKAWTQIYGSEFLPDIVVVVPARELQLIVVVLAQAISMDRHLTASIAIGASSNDHRVSTLTFSGMILEAGAGNQARLVTKVWTGDKRAW